MKEFTQCWNCNCLQRVGSRRDWYSGELITIYYCDKSREYIEGAEHLYSECPWELDNVTQ